MEREKERKKKLEIKVYTHFSLSKNNIYIYNSENKLNFLAVPFSKLKKKKSKYTLLQNCAYILVIIANVLIAFATRA